MMVEKWVGSCLLRIARGEGCSWDATVYPTWSGGGGEVGTNTNYLFLAHTISVDLGCTVEGKLEPFTYPLLQLALPNDRGIFSSPYMCRRGYGYKDDIITSTHRVLRR